MTTTPALKLLALSDLHVTAPTAGSYGLDTHARLEAAMERITGAYGDSDLLVLIGDVTDRGDPKSYFALKAALDRLPIPYAVTLGNHDNREAFATVFGTDHLDPNGFAQRALDVEGHRVILLDTLVEGPAANGNWGHGHGHLCDLRLGWLRDRLDETDLPTIIAFHHPATPLGIQMDAMNLDNGGAFRAALGAHRPRAILSGHVHMTTTTIWDGLTFHTLAGGHTSSTEAYGADGPDTKVRRTGPATMAVVLSDEMRTTIHLDAYVDAHNPVPDRATPAQLLPVRAGNSN
ncbi:MAG: metallophosphoesterase [Pseudomonadota bacterium]